MSGLSEYKRMFLDHAAEVLDAPDPEIVDLGEVKPQEWAKDGQRAVAAATKGDRGHAIKSPRRWLALLYEIQDSMGSVASPSDAERFNRAPMAKSRPSSSTRDSRAVDLITPVDRAVEEAFAKPRTLGDVTYHPAELRNIFELCIAGKATQGDGFVKREPVKPEAIAAHLSKTKAARVTAKHVSLIRGQGMRYVANFLRERGLSEARPKKIKPPTGYDLKGWGAIATYIGGGTGRAHKLASRPVRPLPVHRTANKVSARCEELDDWLLIEISC